MAKMFYTLDETRSALGKSEDEIKQFSRDGRLREFRDGPRLMFKADQVDSLKAQIAGGALPPANVDLGPSDSGAPIGLVDSRGGSGIALADTGSGSGLEGLPGSGMSGSGLTNLSGSPVGSGMMNLKDDTALAADLGLSGASVGSPSPSARGGGTGTGLSGSAGTRAGINIFGDDASGHVDPLAQTAVPSSGGSYSGGSGGTGIDLNLEGVGSGSGLLDLTRESDDTSLGAELLGEMGGKRQGGSSNESMGATAALDAPRGGVVRTSMGGGVTYVEAADPMAAAFGGMAIGAAADIGFAIFALVAAMLGSYPDTIKNVQDKNIFILMAFALVAPLVGFIIGMIVGRSR